MGSSAAVAPAILPLRKTLGFELCCWFLAVGLLPLAVACAVTFYSMRSETEELVTDELISRATRHLNAISEALQFKEEELVGLSLDGESAKLLAGLESLLESDGADSEQFMRALSAGRAELDELADTFHLSDILLVTKDGTVAFSLADRGEIGTNLLSGPLSETELGKVVARTRTLIGVETSEYNLYPPTGEPAIFMATPIYLERKIRGTLVGMFDRNQIERLRHEGNYMGETGETIIVSGRKEGAMMIAPTRFDPDAAFKRIVPFDAPGGDTLVSLLNGHQGSGVTTDYRGKRVLAHWKYLPAFRWGILVKMDLEEAFSPIRALGVFTLFVCGVTALGVVLVAISIAREITSPLKTLSNFTRVIATGDFAKQVSIDSGNEIGLLAQSVNEMVLGLKERETVKTAFARYVSHQILDTVIETGQVPEVKGERRRITALFSDIRGFTSLSEKMTSEEVVEILNTYFEQMVRIVFRNKGTIDKFIGDGLMVIFGAPLEDPEQEKHAVQSAIEMQAEVARLRERWLKEKNIEVRIGIGINTGAAIVGNIGSTERLEYTAIGDTVNLASRLESATKELHADIVISETTRSAVANDFVVEPRGEVLVKGKEMPVAVFEVKSLASPT